MQPPLEQPPTGEHYENEIAKLQGELRRLSDAAVLTAEISFEVRCLQQLEELLEQNYKSLARECQFERDRGHTLELVARNEPQEEVLESILDLIGRQNPAIAAAVFLVEADGLHHAASRGVNEAFSEAMRRDPPHLNSPAVANATLMGEPVFTGCVADLPNLDTFRKNLLDDGWQSCSAWPAVSTHGQVLGLLCFLGRQTGLPNTDERSLGKQTAQLLSLVLEQRRVYTTLAFQAQHDTLTSLPNRLCFHETMRQVLGSARRRGHKVAMLRLDLDNFKHVNDMFGHRTGDALLREMARRLRSTVRAADSIARMGGDEFAVLLHEMDGAQGAAQAAEKIRLVMAAPVVLQDREVCCSASIGISMFPDHAVDAETLLSHAETALYAARAAGRNSCHFYAAETGAHIHERFELEFQLKRALQQNEFHLLYQPQFSAQNCRLTGVEALLRWVNPSLGLVSPERFIPIAESLGLIVPIGRWALEEACRQSVRWMAAGHRLRMAVNVSPLQFCRPDFTKVVLEVVAYTGMDPSLLELELTESCLMGDSGLVRCQMDELRAAGIRLSLDDFGTGYSSLSCLHQLPVDALKIDRSFIRDLGTDSANARLVESVVRLAQSLQLNVVAEGVENQLQLAALSDLGCEHVQGFLFERPHSAESVEELLRSELAGPAIVRPWPKQPGHIQQAG